MNVHTQSQLQENTGTVTKKDIQLIAKFKNHLLKYLKFLKQAER